MTDRDPLAPIERRQATDINLLYRTLADAIRNASADTPGDLVLTSIDRDAMLREVDAGLDVIFGRYPGDPDSALRQVVERDAARARLVALDEAVSDLRRAMPADLRELVESEAQP